MRLAKQIVWTTFLLVSITSCSFPGNRYQTPSPETDIPLATPIIEEPTPTTDPYHGFAPGSWVVADEGDYGFEVPVNPMPGGLPYLVDIKGTQVSLASADEGLLLSLISEQQAFDITLDDCIELVLERMRMDVEDFQAADAELMMVGMENGSASKISGMLFEQPFEGLVAAARPWQGRCFSTIGIALGEDAQARWLDEGSPVLEVILESLDFEAYDPVGECETSGDATYGYSADNPVRVGNSRLYDGLAREQAYLGVLVTMDGEAVSAVRSGSMINDAGDILDVYLLTIPGQAEESEIYIDFYIYEPLKAPMNLSCNAPFPIGAP